MRPQEEEQGLPCGLALAGEQRPAWLTGGGGVVAGSFGKRKKNPHFQGREAGQEASGGGGGVSGASQPSCACGELDVP